MEELSDSALVMAIARYDPQALAEAYRRHGGAVYGLARRVLGGDASSAEEVAQEVFLRLWNEPQKFDPERGSLRSYLMAQTHGRSVDMVRSSAARSRREVADARRTETPHADVEAEVWSRALASHVRDALDALPDSERQAIELAYFGGHTYRQVADELGQPEGTVKSRIRNGLTRLRRELAISGNGGGT